MITITVQMATIKNTKTTNKVLFDTIRDLKKLSTKTNVNLWRGVARLLAKTSSQRPQVNLSKIDKHTTANEVVIVPGKVLGDGVLTKKVKIIGFRASESAIRKIEASGSQFIEIQEYIKKDTKERPTILG